MNHVRDEAKDIKNPPQQRREIERKREREGERVIERQNQGIKGRMQYAAIRGGGRMTAAPAVLKERDAGVFDFPWSDAANYGAGVSKSWNRVWICSLFSANRCRTGAGPVHRSLSPNRS